MSKPRRRSRQQPLPKRIAKIVLLIVLSMSYYGLVSMLLLFGFIVGWDNEPGQPLIGSLMIVAGVLVFIFMPRLVKKLTGREMPSPPVGA